MVPLGKQCLPLLPLLVVFPVFILDMSDFLQGVHTLHPANSNTICMQGIAAYAEAELSVLYWYLSIWFALLSAKWGYWKNQCEMPEAWEKLGKTLILKFRARLRVVPGCRRWEKTHHWESRPDLYLSWSQP